MNIDELNTWILSEEGKAWADGLKQPLIAKRDELLENLRQANGKTAEALRAKADLEGLYSAERQAVEKTVVDGELSRLLKNARVMEPAIPGILAELKEAHGLAVKADGPNRIASGKVKGPDGAEREAGLDEIVKSWTETPAAKNVILIPGSSGGGSWGGSRPAMPYTRETIAKMSPREVATKLDDPAFQSALTTL